MSTKREDQGCIPMKTKTQMSRISLSIADDLCQQERTLLSLFLLL